MRALVVPQRGRLKIEPIAPPAINDYQALVRMECCGICNSTDWKIINGQMSWAGPFPLVLGHESIGKVVQIGEKVRKFKVGDRVTRPVYPKSETMNSAFGGFGEYGIVTDAQAMADDGDSSLAGDYVALRQNVVRAGIDPVHAALAISLAETASGLIDLPNLRNRQIIVAGTGIAGLAFILWCKLAGAHVIALGRRAERLELARRLGADVAINTKDQDWVVQSLSQTNGGADGIIEAVGDVQLAGHLLKLRKPQGFAAAYGAPPDGQAYPEQWDAMNVREQVCYDWVCDLLQRRWINPDWFITHTWQFDEVVEAFERVQQGRVLKGFVRFSD